MSLEGSTPLSQNPEGNTAAAISDVNDNSNILQSDTKSSPQSMLLNENIYGFAYEVKNDPKKKFNNLYYPFLITIVPVVFKFITVTKKITIFMSLA